ncbi:MAG: murein biosynthesis integral membrane protein MurJ [Beutenbergiaceae bacterium]
MTTEAEHATRPIPVVAAPPPISATPKKPGLAISAAVMAAGTLVSRILGLVRNALLVAVVGLVAVGQAGSMGDAWSVANKLPNIISMLLAGGILNAVLVPQVVRAMARKDGGADYVNRLLTIAMALLAAITLVLTAAAALLIHLYAAQFTPEWKAVTIALAYWCIPQLFFYGLYTLLGQVLNARQVFGPYMWAPALNNVVAIAGLVTFLAIYGGVTTGAAPAQMWTADKLALLGGSATLGVVAQALILIIPLYRSGFRYRPEWGFRGHGLGKASTVASWAFAALAVGQLGYLAVSNLAAAASSSNIDGQAVAGNFAYDYAFLIFMLPQSLVTVSLVTALFTRLASNASAGATSKVRDDLSMGVRTLSIFTVFASGAFMVLAIPLVQVVVLGNADFAAYQAVAAVLVAMSLGLVSIAIWTMVQRVFYAYEDTRTLFRIQAPMAILLVIGCVLSWWLLEPQWWVAGAGGATTVSNTFGAILGYVTARKYLPDLDGARVIRTHIRVVLAMVPPALAGWGLLHLWGVQTSFWGATIRVVTLGLFMLIGYLLLLRMLGVSELTALAQRALAPLRRFAGRSTGAGAPDLRTIDGPTISGKDGPAVSADVAVLPGAGHVLADRYRLEVPHDQAVSGICSWDGTDIALGKAVRIQILPGPQRAKVLDSARRAALIEDPHLPPVLRVGTVDGHGFVVTERPVGTTLATLLASGPLPASQARALVGEAGAVLDSAHRQGVHHLSLSPDNLVVTSLGEVRLTGLGIDAVARGREIANPRRAGERDALGLVELLYAALTGTWPGQPELAAGLPLAQRDNGIVKPVGDVVAQVPAQVEALCALALSGGKGGAHTAGQVVAELSPWEEVDVAALERALPPVVLPSVVPVMPLESINGGASLSLTLDTSGWTPHSPPPTAPELAFEELLAAAEDDARGGPPTHASDPDPAPEPAATDATDATDATNTVASSRAEAAAEPAVAGSQVHVTAPTTGVTGDAIHADATADSGVATGAAEVTTTGERVAPDPDQLPSAIPATPVLTRHPIGWDMPGMVVAPAPTSAIVTTPSQPAPARQDWTIAATTAAARLGAAARWLGRSLVAVGSSVVRAFKALGSTNRRINQASAQVEGGARQILHGAGQQLGGITDRAGAFIDDVRDEFRPVESATTAPDGRSRFNPAPIVLTAMVALVIFGLVMAVLTLRDAATAFVPEPNPWDDVPSAQPTDSGAPAPEPAPEIPDSTEPDAPVPAGAIAITEGITFDPTVSGGENQDSAYLAFDGNPETTWNSLRYNSPTFGMKPGLGYTVMLAEPALVSSVTLTVNGHGGLVEIRAGTPAAPNEGTVLASGAMDTTVTFTLAEPVETDSISLWFPQLPVANSDGRNRIELAEVSLG